MLADIARPGGAQNGIDQRMDRDIGIRMAGKAVAMLQPHPAQPQLLARFKAVNIIAGADPHGRCRAEIVREGQLVQGFVSFDQRHAQPGGLHHLGIVACIGCAGPPAVRSQDIGIAEGLWGLHAAQGLAPRRGTHVCSLGMNQRIHHRQHRDRAGLIRQRRQQPIDHRARQVGPGGVMDQHRSGRGGGQRLQPGTDRALPTGRSGH